MLLWAAGPCAADELSFRVTGPDGPMLANVENRLAAIRPTGAVRLSRRRLASLVERTKAEADAALRPFGYYRPVTTAELVETGDRVWRIDVRIDPGPPLLVSSSRIEVVGPGADLPELQSWLSAWPLGTGRQLDQGVWEAQKQDALALAEGKGYLSAQFLEQVIEIDLERYEAALRLKLDTGPRAVIGSVVYEQDVIRPDILQPVPRFSEGQYYDAWLLERFRLDLWRLGYFEYVDVIEERRLEDSPPRVNLVVRASARTRNTYQGSVGYGTDTGIRAQVNWTRHLISDRGDRLEMALGWQQEFNQYSFRTNYRLPRRSKARDFWIADLLANRENQDVRVKVGDVGDDYIQLTNGTVEDYSLRFGRLIIRGFDRGFEQLFETWYGEYLVESANVSLSGILRQAGRGEPRDAIDDYRTRISSLAFGINWDLPVIRGRGFRTVGHHERAWALVADEAWGSDRDFAQLYLSSSWHRLIGERWKLLLRGEVGYTDADVADVELDLGEQLLQLSLTELPNFYRFKAGGSRSVRGYSFESLSNNGIGSNNIITASAELEMNFLENWSVAAFFDVGNAFNDWDDVDLVKGAGAGIRWYSIAGALRLDVAQALDIDGNPWRIHFTVGTPLL